MNFIEFYSLKKRIELKKSKNIKWLTFVDYVNKLLIDLESVDKSCKEIKK